MPDTEWHWEQGTKYAVEALKALLVINGGAAVALLAFAGQISKNGGDLASTASRLGNSLLGFGLGALFAAMAFVAAYIAPGAARTTVGLIFRILPPTYG